MAFPITKGLGGDGTTLATMVITQGYGGPGGDISPLPFQVNTVSVTPTYIDLIFNQALGPLTLQANSLDFWTFAGPVPITATAVAIVAADTVRVSITEGFGGGVYTLTMPLNGLRSITERYYNGAEVLNFTAAAVSPIATWAQVINARSLRVIFSEPVQEAEALVASNYQITNPALDVNSVTKETDSIYIITTDLQESGHQYTLTVYNVKDLSNNPV